MVFIDKLSLFGSFFVSFNQQRLLKYGLYSEADINRGLIVHVKVSVIELYLWLCLLMH